MARIKGDRVSVQSDCLKPGLKEAKYVPRFGGNAALIRHFTGRIRRRVKSDTALLQRI
jgi:hypothetical protein